MGSSIGSIPQALQVLFEYNLPEELRNIIMKLMVKIANRGDFIGKYVGYTVPTTKKFLKEHRGGIIIINNAQSLVNDYDIFGNEALATILQHNDQIIIFDLR